MYKMSNNSKLCLLPGAKVRSIVSSIELMYSFYLLLNGAGYIMYCYVYLDKKIHIRQLDKFKYGL